jgi:hypothetical protein
VELPRRVMNVKFKKDAAPVVAALTGAILGIDHSLKATKGKAKDLTAPSLKLLGKTCVGAHLHLNVPHAFPDVASYHPTALR